MESARNRRGASDEAWNKSLKKTRRRLGLIYQPWIVPCVPPRLFLHVSDLTAALGILCPISNIAVAPYNDAEPDHKSLSRVHSKNLFAAEQLW